MTDTQLQAAPAPGYVSQATSIEQTRATAEVLGAIEAAQRWPRDTNKAIRDLTAACGMLVVAEQAVYEYRRGGDTISGPTVELARTIALCWQHIHYGIRELSRDETRGQSEVLAYAWDVQTGVRADRIFILPHKRYMPKKNTEVVRMVDLRDIQENNLSVGGRNVRETIYSVLPPFLKDLALRECNTTLTEGPRDERGNRVPLKPLELRIAECIDSYADVGVTERQLADRIKRRPDRWSPNDLVRLGNVYRSIQQGLTTVDTEFPAPTVSAAELISAAPTEVHGPASVHSGSSVDTPSPAETS